MIKLNNKADLTALRQELDSALAEVGTRMGINISMGAMGYDADGSNATAKLSFESIDENGNAMSKERKDFLALAEVYGMKPTDIDREFTSQGRKFRVSGFRTRARKLPITAIDIESGKTYIFKAEVVAKKFN